VRGLLAAWLLGLAAFISPAIVAAAERALDVWMLDVAASGPTVESVTNGSLDAHFGPMTGHAPNPAPETLWLRVRSAETFNPTGIPVLIARMGWFQRVEVFPAGAAVSQPLSRATEMPEFGGAHDSVFILPGALKAGQSVYVRVATAGGSKESLRFSVATLDETLARAAEHSRMIAIAFGALMAMSLGAVLIWFILKDKLFILYPALFFLEALYLVFFSGQGFYWPLLSYARAVSAYTWNVPVALGGAVACLFIREIADLKHFSPRAYTVFGWLAWTFVVLAFSNVARVVGLDGLVAAIGNIAFVGTGIFTLVVAFLAWRSGNQAAGWFLIAWVMLETFAIATAVRLLIGRAEQAEGLLYYGLPLSIVAAAILVALGVADRLREQRLALSDAERRAQTDPLTGVLNRRSLIEHLDAACLRARARGLPIALLFIDLDHFKEINDTFGHAAGDACLHAIIGPIQTELRQSDVIGRYGGEEFVVMLSSADIAAAHPIAERIRNRVADVRIEGYGTPIRLTCSIGVATSDTLGVWGEHLIAQADAAVYAAKRSGRNRVQVAAPMAA
jgi:diguanylate cyclase (GGDEF)-like protein